VRRKRKRPGRHSPWRKLLRWIAAGLLGAYAVVVAGLIYLRWLPPLVTTVQIQRLLEAAWAGKEVDREYRFVRLPAISDHLEHAVVAAEDARFFRHNGIDWDALERSARGDRRHKPFSRGGSTITQQLVKNLFFTTHRLFLRKLIEVPLTWTAELILPKRRILELYLNVAEWGPGVYGAEAAARHHYGISAAQLGREQSARLAACLPAPRLRKPQAMHSYSATIQRRMRQMGY
jgi:monofunctional biosynthetic peptidoglycan transglycosylase